MKTLDKILTAAIIALLTIPLYMAYLLTHLHGHEISRGPGDFEKHT